MEKQRKLENIWVNDDLKQNQNALSLIRAFHINTRVCSLQGKSDYLTNMGFTEIN
jgi:hypothetical protein